jgi:hypothetical protein
LAPKQIVRDESHPASHALAFLAGMVTWFSQLCRPSAETVRVAVTFGGDSAKTAAKLINKLQSLAELCTIQPSSANSKSKV